MRGELIDYVMNEYEMNRKDAVQLILNYMECGELNELILDAITANRIEDKNAQIQAQQNEINALRLAASQEKQNNYLIEQLGQKCPVPAYLTCNPNQSIPVQYVATGCNPCGCNGYNF